MRYSTQVKSEEDPRELHRYLARNESMERAYRIIYRLVEHRVFVHIIADERRDMQSLLERRLLRS